MIQLLLSSASNCWERSVKRTLLLDICIILFVIFIVSKQKVVCIQEKEFDLVQPLGDFTVVILQSYCAFDE